MKLKNIARNVLWDKDRTPQELATQIKNLPDSTLLKWAEDNNGIPNSPLAFQQKLVKIELAKRGLSTNNMSESLEQIVKETVAKIVTEKHLTTAENKKKEEIVKSMKKDFNGPAPVMYAIATKKAEKLAEDNLNKDHEVSMAQSSLDSIIRSATELKTKIGNNEIDIPAWIQDHITNSENYIDQASQGYHEYSNGGGSTEMNEFNLGHNETASIEQEGPYWIVTYKTMDGTKEKVFKSEDEAKKFFKTLNESQHELEEGLGDAQYYKAISAADSKTSPMDSISSVKRFLKTKFKNLDDNNIDYLAKEWAKKTGLNESQQELEEAMIRRWQHYAGIK